jgi:hypothetical protein
MFTPGPWTYHDGRILDTAGNVIAEEVSFENGRLIEAAPAMYALVVGLGIDATCSECESELDDREDCRAIERHVAGVGPHVNSLLPSL